MTWNYRVISKEVNGVCEETEYGIYEVYYNKDGKPTSCTVNSVSPYSCTDVEDLKLSVELMLPAFDKPVLKYEDFV